MLDKVLGRNHCNHMYIDVTPPSIHGRCSYKEFRKWKDRMDAIFDGDYYSEREKVKLPLVLSMTILLNGGMRRNIVGIFMVTDHSIRGMS